jgi:hypothetical protein
LKYNYFKIRFFALWFCRSYKPVKLFTIYLFSMKKIAFSFFLFLIAEMGVFAQVGINSDGTPPDSSAMLEVKSPSKGFLPPRVALTATNLAAPVGSPAVGLQVYNTSTSGTSPFNVTPGIYSWNGAQWIPVLPPRGVNVGDMQYWNGTQWIIVPGGSYGQTLTFCNGIPTWNGCISLLTTAPVTYIGANYAVGTGTITNSGGTQITAKGVCWSTVPNPTIANSIKIDGSSGNSIYCYISGLSISTTYYVRAYATNTAGTGYGNEVTFTTQNGVANLTTSTPTSITAMTATSGGNITSDGGSDISARGVCWSTSPNPTIANSKTINGYGTGSFTSNMTGLNANTLYYVRAYATNGVGTFYGNEITFTTQNGVVNLTTTSISNIFGARATSGGNITNDGGAAVTARGICWSLTAGPTTSNSKTVDGTGAGSFISNMNYLNLNTTYFVRAYATNSVGTYYGNELSFTTASFLSIGDGYGGGIVFYLDGTGSDGLIAAPTDQSTGAQWGCYGTLIPGTSNAIGTGQANTTAIVNACNTSGIAARICNDLVLNGYSDWYLPSKDELNQMYLQRTVIGGFGDWYWTSSDGGNAHYAVYQNLQNGTQAQMNKGFNYYIRAIRAFCQTTPTAPSAGTHVPALAQIIWNWNPVPFAAGYKWNTTNNYATAIDMGTNTSKTETGLTCNTGYTRYIWAYKGCGNSIATTVSQTTLATVATPVAGNQIPGQTMITWNWDSVPGATGYKWNIVDDYATATDLDTATTYTENGLTCNTTFTRYVWSYIACGNSTPVILTCSTFTDCFICGSSMTINHVVGAVSPVNKTVSYGTVTNIPGESSKCWITSNLGSDHQATAGNDTSEASAGWYWQFNLMQGYQHNATIRTPNTSWITPISQNSDWLPANDPCTIELGTQWRIPTISEWDNVSITGGWGNGVGTWNSVLKIHAAGYLYQIDGFLNSRGDFGYYHSSAQSDNEFCRILYLWNGVFCFSTYENKATGQSVRCIRDF